MNKGQRVKMSDNAIENYGGKWRNVIFRITHKATAYMPAAEFYAKGMPENYHPGYDDAAHSPLYDLKREDTGITLPFSLYGWELVPI